jgi:hypothetical protein
MREVREREQAYCDRPCGLCLSKQGLGWVRLSVLNRRAQLQAALMLYPMLCPPGSPPRCSPTSSLKTYCLTTNTHVTSISSCSSDAAERRMS